LKVYSACVRSRPEVDALLIRLHIVIGKQPYKLVTVFFAAVVCLALAGFSPPPPREKPGPEFNSNLMPSAEFAQLKLALFAADDGEWDKVRTARQTLRDPLARRLLLWRIASSSSSNPSFAELDEALTSLGDWPMRRTIQTQAEEKISSSGWSAQRRVEWLRSQPSLSGEGKVALANALFSLGQDAEGTALLKDAWRNHSLMDVREREILAAHGDKLNAADHLARADLMIWTRQFSDARRLIDFLGADEAALIRARIAVANSDRGLEGLIARVPARLQADPGLMYERARWRRNRSMDEGALELLFAIDATKAHPEGQELIWRERHLYARRLFKDRKFQDAYRLTINHGMTSGVEFAEAEWLSGWIALEYLNKPGEALKHFERLESGVGSPLSLSRAVYWQGRAHADLGDSAAANADYRRVSQWSYTFYGQLGAQAVDAGATVSLGADAIPTSADRARFLADERVRAAILLAEAGELGFFQRFAFHLDDALPRAADHTLMAELADRFLMPIVGIRAGKAGLAAGVISPSAAYPVPQLPNGMLERTGGLLETAFVLALSRQESEFNPQAVSRVGASGLMQLMPATAQATARSLGLPYRQSWLLDDPTYNLELGWAHLEELLEDYDGSYIMAAAAYNAGASRVRSWVADYGDPRDPGVDPINWIESIPFSETRNYVHRVLENTQVYRHRLTTEPAQIRTDQDIRRGRRGQALR